MIKENYGVCAPEPDNYRPESLSLSLFRSVRAYIEKGSHLPWSGRGIEREREREVVGKRRHAAAAFARGSSFRMVRAREIQVFVCVCMGG